jgi:hypothetical protein
LLFTKINGRIEGIFGDEIVSLEEQPDCVRVELKVIAGSISRIRAGCVDLLSRGQVDPSWRLSFGEEWP